MISRSGQVLPRLPCSSRCVLLSRWPFSPLSCRFRASIAICRCCCPSTRKLLDDHNRAGVGSGAPRVKLCPRKLSSSEPKLPGFLGYCQLPFNDRKASRLRWLGRRSLKAGDDYFLGFLRGGAGASETAFRSRRSSSIKRVSDVVAFRLRMRLAQPGDGGTGSSSPAFAWTATR